MTLGHFSDLLDTIPKKFRRHWMSIDRAGWWLRSADDMATMQEKESNLDTSLSTGTDVNPSNGVPFPGAF